MKTASVVARYLAGVIFLVMGLNGFLHFIPFPPPPGVAGQFMGALYVSHYLWVIFAFQVIAGVLLLVSRYVPLAVALLAPVIVNILTFHALMAPSGLPLALFVAVLWAAIFIDVRPAFSGLFQSALAAAGLTAGERNKNMAQELTVVVTGSTGKQGGAVARGLLERGHKVPRRHARPELKPGEVARERRGDARCGVARRHCGDHEGARRSDLSLRDDDAVRRYGRRDTTRYRRR